jgi:hypothetical protein
MTRIEAEMLSSLFHHPGWATLMAYKQSRLDECHKALEWEENNVKKLQGRVEEIRKDLSLQAAVESLLSKS